MKIFDFGNCTSVATIIFFSPITIMIINRFTSFERLRLRLLIGSERNNRL